MLRSISSAPLRLCVRIMRADMRLAVVIKFRLAISPHPAVGGVGPLAALAQIGLLQAAERVFGKGLPTGFDIDAVNLRGVEAENLGFVVFGQLGISELVAQLVGDLKALERIDDPLRRAPPEAI